MRLPHPALCLFFCGALSGLAIAKPIVGITPADGLASPGNPVLVTLASAEEVVKDAAPIALLRENGKIEIGRPAFAVKNNTKGARAYELETTLERPGALLVLAQSEAGGAPLARAGFIFAPEKIEPAAQRPADFDAFWDARLESLARVPVDPELHPGKFSAPAAKGVAYSQFSLAVGPHERVRGQLAYPDRPGEKFPALVIYQWAGVYPLQPGTVTGNAAKGWLAVNVMAHDLPIYEPKAYYDELAKGALKDYGAIGADDRERSYFLRMFLGARRVLDFVRAHPAWDGRVLVTHGTSQGGTQALVAAALDPAVTAVVANVPALCDQNGPEAGRAMPYPYWLAKTDGRDPAAVAGAARYYDVAHFAPRIRVPVLVSAGLIDETCPPSGIAAMANRLAGPREVLFMPQANHQGADDSHRPYLNRAEIWLDALRKGEAPPKP